jgi:membrane-associated phospholipid phosphatase
VRRVRRPGPLVVIAIVYLVAASAVMIWRGISVSPDYILLLAVPVALLSGRFLGFLRDWIPFIAIYLGYEALRGIAGRTGIAPHVRDIAGVETGLFGGHVPSAVLQAATPGTLGRALALITTVVYFSHFVVPFGVGLILWLADRTQFLRYTVGLMSMAFAGFFVFLLLPTAPPWYAENHGVIHGVTKLLGTTLPSAISPYYQTLYNTLLSDPVAAFPSLHVGFPFISFLALRRVYSRASWLALAWTVVVSFSVVYLGEHWAVDAFGGVLFAAVCWAVLMRVAVPRMRMLQERARATAAAAPRPAEGSAVA